MTYEQKILENELYGVDLYTLQNMALNPKLHPSTLDKLSNHFATTTRQSVAANPTSSHSTLEKLSEDKEICVKFQVVKNPSTSLKTLDKLSQDCYKILTIEGYNG